MSCCYQLVIVEDEENTRRGLVNFVPWNELGFKVVGDFADGSDALEYLQAHPCDVVMTDIMMARMNGLEMIAEISKFSPQGLFVNGKLKNVNRSKKSKNNKVVGKKTNCYNF